MGADIGDGEGCRDALLNHLECVSDVVGHDDPAVALDVGSDAIVTSNHPLSFDRVRRDDAANMSVLRRLFVEGDGSAGEAGIVEAIQE
jgi:hypothetical protein